MATTITFIATLIFVALGQESVPRPTEGCQVGNPDAGLDVILPLSIAQCEPVLIYYNITSPTFSPLLFSSPYDFQRGDFSLLISIPDKPKPPTGYLDWICNVPAGYPLIIWGLSYSPQWYIVQPGLSSDCLGPVTVTVLNSAGYYQMPEFQSYTQNPPSIDSAYTTYQQPTTSFPTNALPTLTFNPNTAFVSLTSTLTASAVVSPYPQRPHYGEIAGWVVGGIVLVALTLISVFLLLRRKARLNEEMEPISIKYDSGQPEPGVLFVPNTDTPPISSHDNSSLAQTWPSAPSIPNELALTPVVSPTTQKGQPIILTYHPFTNETTTTHSQLAAMHPNTTMMPTAQPATQAYHLPNTSANDTSPEITAYSNQPSMSIQPLPAPNTVLTTYHPPQPSTSEAGTLHPEVAAALDTISRAKLTTDQRQALITSLNSPVETAPEPPDLLRSNTLSSPPPYQE